MLEGQPSLTALWVAFSRAVSAYEHDLAPWCPDLVAPALLPRAVTRLIQSQDGKPHSQSTLRLLRYATLGLIDHLALRTYLIDEALKAALASGIDQVVLLGAGLDARAYRINAAKDATVFEVDHPSTQTYKRKRAQRLSPTAREVRYAACDFETVTLEQALASVSFDAARRSVWIWEGVTMYLPNAAVSNTLDTIGLLTATGSVVSTTYVTPDIAAIGPVLGRVGMGLLSAIAEPVRSMFTPRDMAKELSSRGLSVQSDVVPLEQAKPLGVSNISKQWLAPDERLVVAKRIDG